jgi:hypothetical protein
MSEYLKRENVLALAVPIPGCFSSMISSWDVVHMPAADVVEVVRCKDCVNWCGFEHCKNGICDVDPVSKRATYPDDFCSHGERREQE